MGRHLKDENIDLSTAGAIPVAFAVWDGKKLGRDGVKLLSSWIAVDFDGKKGNEDLVKELTAKPSGNAEAGKANVEAMCSSCHTLSSDKPATPYMAPSLTNIGGYGTVAYLAESIIDPSAVVVPGYNRNAHKNFAWYNVDDKGVRTSTMPPMMTDKAMIDDAVAYLKTLKAEVEK
jgi:complex iron-sulfur molybdoenzyme family reductase subunit gamma